MRHVKVLWAAPLLALLIISVLGGCTASPEEDNLKSEVEAIPSKGAITVHVKGLSCPFCVLGIEKRLKAKPSVIKVSSDWGKGEIYVVVTEGQSVTDDELRDAVKRAGFPAGTIERPDASDKGGAL